MGKLTGNCSYCGGELHIERLRCKGCNLAVEGEIQLPRLARLESEDRDFIELFVRVSGSLKDMSKQLGISYPTMRNRLNRIIELLTQEISKDQMYRKEILDKFEQGKIKAEKAIKLLREL
ncbi:DUF2089 domain-containing protein [Thermodesulfobacteriota bacterium]